MHMADKQNQKRKREHHMYEYITRYNSNEPTGIGPFSESF